MTVMTSLSTSGIFTEEACAAEEPPFKMSPAINVAPIAADVFKNSLRYNSRLLKLKIFSSISKNITVLTRFELYCITISEIGSVL